MSRGTRASHQGLALRSRFGVVPPWPCVTMGIDPGRRWGAAIVDLDGSAEVEWTSRRQAVDRAVETAAARDYPIIVAIERTLRGGPFGGVRTQVGVAEHVGRWLGLLEDAGVPTRHVLRVANQTWHSAIIGGRMERDKARRIRVMQARFPGVALGPDSADALGMAAWARCAPEALAAIGARRLKALGVAGASSSRAELVAMSRHITPRQP